MKKYSLTQALLGSQWLQSGVIAHPDGSISKGFEVEPLPSGILEESFDGPISEGFYAKLSDLLTKLPNLFEGHILLCRRTLLDAEVPGFVTKLYCFENVSKPDSYSHLAALLSELKLDPEHLTKNAWQSLLSGIFGSEVLGAKLPDLTWARDSVRYQNAVIRVLSLTELPQVTWKGCLQPIFENPCDFTLSLRISVPDRNKIKRQLETKRRVSHALSITSSLEIRNIESNSVLSSSEETLERILVGKETLFEISASALLFGSEDATLMRVRDFERVVSGIGNAGLFLEGIGTLPILKSHIPNMRFKSGRAV